MQTLKTAAIVVLLVTVMYGAYVSITTPPQDSHPNLEDYLVETGDLDIDVGLPDSLGDLQISMGTQSGDQDTSASGPVTPPDRSAAVTTTPPATQTPTPAVASVRSGTSATLSDANPAAAATPDKSSAVVSLPPTGGVKPSPQLDPQQTYATTETPFALPTAVGGAKPNSKLASSVISPLAAAAAAAGGFQEGNVKANPMFRPESQPAGKPLSPPPNTAMSQLGMSTPPAAPSADTAAAGTGGKNIGLANAIRMADSQYMADQKTQALATLSLFYDTPGLSPAQRTEMLSRLDPLAREVIYSPAHLLEQPHRVRQNETLMQIAETYQVPWQLLANINDITDPITVLPGTDLKVVRGPFRADVDLQRGELTLFLKDLYAGRFPIAVGTDPPPQPGTFKVSEKQSARIYYDKSGNPVPAGSPGNPYGGMWMDLGGNLCIHGSPDANTPTANGCISVADRFAGDLYGILSQGSTVTIRR